jgi:hypothetical protein
LEGSPLSGEGGVDGAARIGHGEFRHYWEIRMPPVKLIRTKNKPKRISRVVKLERPTPRSVKAAERALAAKPKRTSRTVKLLSGKPVQLLSATPKIETPKPTATKAAKSRAYNEEELAAALKGVGHRPLLFRHLPFFAEKVAEMTKKVIDFRLSELVAKVTKLEGEVATLRLQLAKRQ